MNVKLLTRIKNAIVRKPKGYDQNVIIFSRNDCGSLACIAGHALLLGMKNSDLAAIPPGSYRNKAKELLGLTPVQADRLFPMVLTGHPSQYWGTFGEKYLRAANPTQRAKVAAARIDHFIKTNGAE